MVTLNINDRTHRVDVEADMPLLWVLRDELDLKRMNYGCGAGICGACAVRVDRDVLRPCVVPVGSVEGKRIATIEALAQAASLHSVQQAGSICRPAAALPMRPTPCRTCAWNTRCETPTFRWATGARCTTRRTRIFRECFVDGVAATLGKDPHALRRELLAREKPPRNLRMLGAVARAAGWDTPAPAGLYRGFALADGYGSYAACVVELRIDSSNLIDLKRVIVAVDPGYVVNPDSARAQIEGNVVFALTAALYGEITIRNGRVEQGNFDDYRMMLLRECPKSESVLAPSGGFWAGIGEPPLMLVASAGQRHRRGNRRAAALAAAVPPWLPAGNRRVTRRAVRTPPAARASRRPGDEHGPAHRRRRSSRRRRYAPVGDATG